MRKATRTWHNVLTSRHNKCIASFSGPQSNLMTMITSTAAASRAVAQHSAAVIGGSLGGLAAAHALSQSGFQVDVFERSQTAMSRKGSGLGYVNVPAWESLVQAPMIRRRQRANRQQGSFYYGDLWRFLFHPLQDVPDVNIQFGSTIDSIGGTVEQPTIFGKQYDLVIVANGGFSQFRKYVLEDSPKSQQEPDYAGYVVWRGGVDEKKLPYGLLRDIQFLEGVYKSGIYDTIVLKMAKDDGTNLWTMGTFIATPEDEVNEYWSKETDGQSRHNCANSEDTSAKASVPSWFLAHMRKHFGDIPGMTPLLEYMVKDGEVSPHPQYEFGAIDRVHKGRVILLGDAAHMASPRTAVGAHTAIMDALALREAFQRTRGTDASEQSCGDIDLSIQRYSESGLMNARNLYARTRQVSAEFVPSEGLSAIQSPGSLLPL